MKRILGALAAAVLAGGCGSHLVQVPTERPSPAPTVSPGAVAGYPHARVLVDPTGPISLTAGDEVILELSTAAGFQPWGPVSSSNPDAVAALYPPAAAAMGGGLRNALVALNPGTAELTASTTPICTPPTALPAGTAYACPALARAWEAAVTVSPGPRGPVSILAVTAPGLTVHLKVHDRLTLPAALTQAADSDPAVLAPSPRNADGTQTFTAAGPGQATLSALTDAPCLHARPACMIAQMEERVTVQVTA